MCYNYADMYMYMYSIRALTLVSDSFLQPSSLPLCSHFQSTDTLQSSYDFLIDVLFQDLPPEIFLQRPAILNVSSEP